jgi:GNAT superfamily N-acetyltransferase
MSSVRVREASAADAPVILALVKELAAYEKEPDAVDATAEDFVRDGFGERPLFQVLLAEWEGEVVGLAFYFYAYSTWRGRPTLFLEDLFVKPEHRGRKIGITLMRELARIAVAKQCRRFVWQVLDWNEPSIRFYEGLGAKVMREWLTVRLEGEALERLAARAT